jgi:hypothetical protein
MPPYGRQLGNKKKWQLPDGKGLCHQRPGRPRRPSRCWGRSRRRRWKGEEEVGEEEEEGPEQLARGRDEGLGAKRNQ